MIKILKHMSRRDIWLVFASLLFIIAQVYLDLKMPDYMADITRLVQTEGSTISEILSSGGMMLLCALGSLVSSVIVVFFAARVATAFSARIREMVFNKTISSSTEEINKFSISSLITRSTNDITQIQTIVAMGLQLMIKAPILAIWAISKIAGKQWQFTLATGGAVVFLMCIVIIVVVFAIPQYRKIQKQTDQLNLVTRETLTGVRVVRAYNAEGFQEEKFGEANTRLTNTNLFTNRIMALLQPGMSTVMAGLSLAIFWIGAMLIDNAGMMDKLPIFSDMVVFSSYAMQVLMAFMILTMIFVMMPRASVSAKRINEVLDIKPTIIDGHLKLQEQSSQGELEFRGVSFKYPDAAGYALENISFSAHQGETVAFIGATGSGKSTLINLIPRFYDATAGNILVNGIDIKEYAQETLHNKIAYVPQRAVIFSGTVSSNVAYGDNGKESASDEAIIKAANIAQGAEFIEKMDGAYDSAISQGGTNLSGGQRQRLAIARAICRNPEIYIFDDSFSALDYKTDRKLRNALQHETRKITTLIVAQRIGTIKDADKIIVIDQGAVVGMGKHRDLLDTCDVYREIAFSQLSKEELDVG